MPWAPASTFSAASSCRYSPITPTTASSAAPPTRTTWRSSPAWPRPRASAPSSTGSSPSPASSRLCNTLLLATPLARSASTALVPPLLPPHPILLLLLLLIEQPSGCRLRHLSSIQAIIDLNDCLNSPHQST